MSKAIIKTGNASWLHYLRLDRSQLNSSLVCKSDSLRNLAKILKVAKHFFFSIRNRSRSCVGSVQK